MTVLDSGGIEKPLVRSERTLFESTGTPPPDKPPLWLPFYLAIGLGIGAGALALGGLARQSRFSRIGFTALVGTWALVTGFAGLVLAGLWGLTDHAAAYRNENLLQVTLLALPLVWLVPKAARRPSTGSRPAFFLAATVAGLSLLGLVLKVLPSFYQVNGEIIALALPAHLGVAAGVWRLTRR